MSFFVFFVVLPRRWNDAELRRVLSKQIQTTLLTRSQVKIQTIAKVSQCLIIAKPNNARLLTGNFGEMLDAVISRLLKHGREAIHFDARASGPHGKHKRQFGPLAPLVSQSLRPASWRHP